MRDRGGAPVAGASRHIKLGRRSKASPAEKPRKALRMSFSSEISSSDDALKEFSDFSALTEAIDDDANPDEVTTEITDYSVDIPLESRRSNYVEIASLGEDELADILRAAQKQVMESFDANHQSKKLLDALIKYKLDEISTFSEQKACTEVSTCLKVIVPFVFVVLGILLFIIFSSGPESSHRGLLPT